MFFFFHNNIHLINGSTTSQFIRLTCIAYGTSEKARSEFNEFIYERLSLDLKSSIL